MYIYASLPSVDAVRALYGASIVQTERDIYVRKREKDLQINYKKII